MENQFSSTTYSDGSFTLPVEVYCTAPPSTHQALQCLLRQYLSEHLKDFFYPLLCSPSVACESVRQPPSPPASFSSIISGEKKTHCLPTTNALSRTSLLIPILSTAPKPLLQYIRSVRLGEYGPLSLLTSYFARFAFSRNIEMRDPFGDASVESETVFQSTEDAVLFSSFIAENPSAMKLGKSNLFSFHHRESALSSDYFFKHSMLQGVDCSTVPSGSSFFSLPLAKKIQPKERSVENPDDVPAAHCGTKDHDAVVQRSTSWSRNSESGGQISSPSFVPSCTEYSSSLSHPVYLFYFFDLHTENCGKNGEDSSTTNSPNTRVTTHSEEDENQAESSAICTLSLPHTQLEGLWESLLYGNTLYDSRCFKIDLLKYMQTSLLFSSAGVDPHIIHWSRLILLHGPPGSGKTSLCKAIAHKLSIMLHHAFPSAVLVEIHSQQIFSRWFSESGKQVMKTFLHIRKLASNRDRFVCVLMDEVESLVMARHSAIDGNEPSDALRVVNVILTQLDALQQYQNVLLLATSNLVEMIDNAFLDRVDKKVFVGPPGCTARRALIRSSLSILLEKQLVVWSSPLEEVTQLLHKISTVSDGLSGRFLRKVSFLAYHHVCNFGRFSLNDACMGEEARINCSTKGCNTENLKSSDVKPSPLTQNAYSLSRFASVTIFDFLRAILFHVEKETHSIARQRTSLKRSRQDG